MHTSYEQPATLSACWPYSVSLRLLKRKTVGILPGGEFLAVLSERLQRQFGFHTHCLVWLAGGDDVALRVDNATVAAVVVTVTVAADAVTARDIRLVLNSACGQQRLPVQARGAGQFATYSARS